MKHFMPALSCASLRLLAAALSLAPACTRPAPPSPPSPPSRPAVGAAPVPAPSVVAVAAVADAARVAPAPQDPAAAFRALAQELATRTRGFVSAWGTAPLDETGNPVRVAVLLDASNNDDAPRTYLLEDSASRRWLLRFTCDGRTAAWHVEDCSASAPAAPPAWETWTDHSLVHAQSHSHGGATIEAALRNGQLVVLRDQFMDDVRDHTPEIVHRFARQGVCAPRCPTLGQNDPDSAFGFINGTAPLLTREALLAAVAPPDGSANHAAGAADAATAP